MGVDAGDRPVGPALREAAPGFFGFTITMVAHTQEPSGLKPVPRLLPGVLVDVGAHAGAKRIGGALLDLSALAMPTRSMVGDDVVAERAIAVHRRRQLARRLERQRLPDLRISRQLAARSVERPQGNLARPAIRSAKPHLPRLVTAWLDDEEEAARCGVADPAALRAGHELAARGVGEDFDQGMAPRVHSGRTAEAVMPRYPVCIT